MSGRRNGEGSIYPVKGATGATSGAPRPDGGATASTSRARPTTRPRAWLRLRDAARRGPVASDVPSLEEIPWLLAGRNCPAEPGTQDNEKYELFSRLHIIPHLGAKHLDKLQVRDIRQWLNKLSRIFSAAHREKMSPGRKKSAAAARQVNAVRESFLRKRARTREMSCGPHSPVPSRTRSSPGTPQQSSGYPAAASPNASAVPGPLTKRVNSSNPRGTTTMCCTRPTSWSWSSACARGSCWGSPGS